MPPIEPKIIELKIPSFDKEGISYAVTQEGFAMRNRMLSILIKDLSQNQFDFLKSRYGFGPNELIPGKHYDLTEFLPKPMRVLNRKHFASRTMHASPEFHNAVCDAMNLEQYQEFRISETTNCLSAVYSTFYAWETGLYPLFHIPFKINFLDAIKSFAEESRPSMETKSFCSDEFQEDSLKVGEILAVYDEGDKKVVHSLISIGDGILYEKFGVLTYDPYRLSTRRTLCEIIEHNWPKNHQLLFFTKIPEKQVLHPSEILSALHQYNRRFSGIPGASEVTISYVEGMGPEFYIMSDIDLDSIKK